MRLWSLHPKYLDARGLVALWREALLAQAVLRGRTKGYTRHPQLARFKSQACPVGAMAEYLRAVYKEARSRGYGFAAQKISPARASGRLQVSRGQLEFERRHLLGKLKTRDPRRRARLAGLRRPRPHPLFRVSPGGIADWERGGRLMYHASRSILKGRRERPWNRCSTPSPGTSSSGTSSLST